MEVKLVDITQDAERKIEKYVRVCYNSEKEITKNSYKTFLPRIIGMGHYSALSFGHATFHISGVSRAFLAQVTRHAHLRYLVRSQRYNQENEINFVMPEVFNEEDKEFFNNCQIVISEWYSYLNKKYKNEDSRMMLSNAHKTELNLNGSFQGFFDFLKLRLGKHAQLEIRKVAQEIYKILNEKCPHIFNQTNLLIQPKLNLDFGE